jgi:hypothetical protein
LARVYTAMGKAAHKAAFLRGLDYLLAAQHPSGGWLMSGACVWCSPVRSWSTVKKRAGPPSTTSKP